MVRQAKTWSQRTQADFAKGTFSGVSASSKNKLELAPTLKKLVETPEQFVWCVAPATDGIYAGTGNSGKIYHITDNGEIEVFYETGELEVHSLAVDSGGNVYAGTSPHGKVFKITPDGKGQVIFKADEKYVLALRSTRRATSTRASATRARSTRSRRAARDGVRRDQRAAGPEPPAGTARGSLLVGTGINGVVYRVDKSGKAAPIFDAAEDSITSVAERRRRQRLTRARRPRAGSTRSPRTAARRPSTPRPGAFCRWPATQHNNVYAVSDGTLVKIAPDETVIQLDSSQDKVQFLSLAFNEKTGALYAGTGNIGSVYVSKCCDVSGQFESAVHDAQMISRWGRIKWAAETPEGTSVELQTRTGNVATPDSTWSDWSAPYTQAGGEQIAGDPARYVQYRVTLKTASEAVSPRVSSVTISYLTPNQKPTVALQSPAGGEVWAGKETIDGPARTPTRTPSPMTCTTPRTARTGRPSAGGVTGSPSASGPPKKMTEGEIASKVKSELDKSPDVPDDMKKQVTKEPPKEAKPEGAPPATPAAPTSSKTTHDWDTKKVEDGAYQIKVVASDRTSNAIDPRSEDVISEPFVVCNTAPKVTLYARAVEVKGAGSATIKGAASSKLVEVTGVQYRVDGGAWAAAAPADGVFDSPYEQFTITTDSLAVGDHKVEAEAIDAAGNASTATVDVKVSGTKYTSCQRKRSDASRCSDD